MARNTKKIWTFHTKRDSYLESVSYQPYKDVPHAEIMRRLIDRYVFHHTNAPDASGLQRFLKTGEYNPPSPLTHLKALNPKNLKNIVQLSKDLYGKSKRTFIDNIDIWERKVDFLSRTNISIPWLFDKNKENEMKKKVKKHLMGIQKQNKSKANNMTLETYRRYMHEELAKAYTGIVIDESTNRAMVEFMMQSVFQTRYNLRKTYEIRKRYRYETSYRIAIMHTMMSKYFLKIKNLYTTASRHLRNEGVKFLYYLVIYEKILQANTDITEIVRRIFDEHFNYMKYMNPNNNDTEQFASDAELEEEVHVMKKETAEAPPDEELSEDEKSTRPMKKRKTTTTTPAAGY